MCPRVVSVAGLCAALAILTACEVSKSANPLSASVAGPIPGVNISAPKPVDPTSGSKIAVDKQPVTLMVENATTSGVRPINYLFEVATDADFTNKVFARDGIAPGDGGHTGLRLPDPLATERSYYWRVRAQDGANTGPYSSAVNFNVFTPIVIGIPTLVSPAPNSTVDSLRPRFVVNDVTRSGPVGAITYQIELADSDSFANKIAAWTQGEQANQTALDSQFDLAYSKVYYWHVRAIGSGPTIGDWSRTLAFTTPAAPPPPPPPPPPPNSGPGNPGSFNLGSVQIVGSPDIRSWAVTSSITSLAFGGGTLHVDHTKRGQWPPVDIGGALQESTVWVFFRINGVWYGTGGERLRPGQTDKGLGSAADIGSGWLYDPGRWGPMANYTPNVGDPVGFLVAAGSTRSDSNFIVQERTGVVVIPFPGTSPASYPPFSFQER